MEIKPDYRFAKIHTAKGTFYSIEIYIGIEKCFFGYGKTITEAVNQVVNRYNIRIKEIEEVVDILNKKLINKNIPKEINNFDNLPVLDKKNGIKTCKNCGKLITGKRTLFCSNDCLLQYHRRLRNANKNRGKKE